MASSGDSPPLENNPSVHNLTMLGQLKSRAADLKAVSSSPKVANSGVPAAVLAPLILPRWDSSKEEAKLLYIKRSEKLTKHAGQMAFPGGVMEAADQSLLDAGFREGYEEVGLRREQSQVLASLPQATTPSGFQLQAYFVATTQQEFLAQPSEVESIHLIEVEELLNCPVRLEYKVWQEVEYRVVYFDTSSVCIWGVTGRITEVLLNHFFDWKIPR